MCKQNMQAEEKMGRHHHMCLKLVKDDEQIKTMGEIDRNSA